MCYWLAGLGSVPKIYVLALVGPPLEILLRSQTRVQRPSSFVSSTSPFVLEERSLNAVLTACQRGDAAARRALFKTFFSFGKSTCLRYASDVDESEQMLHLGFLRVYQFLDRYDPILPFRTWFRGILIRSCLDFHRQGGRFDHYPSLNVAEMPVPASTIVDQIPVEELLYLVQQLPAFYRTIFSLHVFDGYSLLQIAELLPIEEGTSRALFEKARLKIQERIWASHPHLTPTD